VDLQTAREEPELQLAIRTVLNNISDTVAAELPGLPLPDIEALLRDPKTAVLTCLRQLAAASPRPLVVLFDEADGLVGRSMVSFLTQLRQGYIKRREVPFPHSMALI
jgi:hypothetical protein